MENKSNNSYITTTLLIVFVTLKLTHNVDWSWWIVLSPLWIPVLIVSIFALILGIAMAFRDE